MNQQLHTNFAKATPSRWALAVQDVIWGVLNYRLWWHISWHEIRQRYRRSVLGPFWMTLSMGIQALVMGYLLSFLFHVNNGKFLPFVCISLTLWGLITGCILDAATTFVGSVGTLTQIRRPLSSYIMRTLARNVIVFLHTSVIYFIFATIYGIYPTAWWLLSVPGFLLLSINLVWISLFVGIIGTRYRDVPMILQSCFNVLLWLTPVFYQPTQLSGKLGVITLVNPLSYFLEVVREPLMNHPPHWQSFVLLAGFAVVGWLITIALFARCRSRIVYWI